MPHPGRFDLPQRARRLAIGLAVAAAALGVAPPARAVPTETHFVSGRMAILIAADAETLVIVDALGAATEIIPLDGKVAIPGPGDRYALVSALDTLGVRGVEIRTLGGSSVAAFGIAGERDLAVGHGGLSLTPFGDRAEVVYDLLFLSFSGGPLGSATNPGSRILDLQANEDGGWTGVSMDGLAGWSIHRYAASGSPAWSFPLAGAGTPLVAVSPSGARTAVGALNPDDATTHLELLDGSGSPIRSADLDEWNAGAFDTTESYLALAGLSSVALLNAGSGADLWSSDEDVPLATGDCLAFSLDSDSLFAIEQVRDVDGGPEAVWLVTFADLGGSVQRRARVLSELPSDRRVSLIDLVQLPDRRLRITGEDSLWIVTP